MRALPKRRQPKGPLREVAAESNKQTERIRGMIDRRLKAVSAADLVNVSVGPHVDEDTIAAFVEGRLADDECQPILSHLAACGLCRRASAQFVQLENQVDAEVASSAAEEEPGRLEAMLSRLRSAVPSVSEEVVFAYQNPEDEQTKEADVKKSNSPDDQTP